jgi:hypothetical protein
LIASNIFDVSVFWKRTKEKSSLKKMSDTAIPGEKTTMASHVMDMGSSMLQSFKPLNNVCQHVCGLHMYDGEPNRQIIAHHYCSHLSEELRQCVIYDSPDSKGRLLGVEYIISAKLFDQLPDEEKKYWHSHAYEVKSGALVAPNLPEAVERLDMQKLVGTYGKTWHLWQVDRGDPLPYGPAMLMMALTGDGQADKKLIAEKDRITGIKTDERRALREGIPMPTVSPLADQGLKNAAKKE